MANSLLCLAATHPQMSFLLPTSDSDDLSLRREKAKRLRQREFDGRVRGPLIAMAILAPLAVILFSYQRASSSIVIEPQTLRQQRRTRPKPKSGTQTPVKTATSFSGFKHESHRAPKTKLNCSNCHAIITREAPDEIAAPTKPSFKG